MKKGTGSAGVQRCEQALELEFDMVSPAVGDWVDQEVQVASTLQHVLNQHLRCAPITLHPANHRVALPVQQSMPRPRAGGVEQVIIIARLRKVGEIEWV